MDYRTIASIDFHGLQVRNLTANSTTSASVAEISNPPGGHHPPARSTLSDKFYVGLEGAISFQVDAQVMAIRKGDLLVIERNTWFCYRNSNDVSARLLLFHVSPFSLEREVLQEGSSST